MTLGDSDGGLLGIIEGVLLGLVDGDIDGMREGRTLDDPDGWSDGIFEG